MCSETDSLYNRETKNTLICSICKFHGVNPPTAAISSYKQPASHRWTGAGERWTNTKGWGEARRSWGWVAHSKHIIQPPTPNPTPASWLPLHCWNPVTFTSSRDKENQSKSKVFSVPKIDPKKLSGPKAKASPNGSKAEIILGSTKSK